jgi:anti-sigma factor ChrR (cupin superfamily)
MRFNRTDVAVLLRLRQGAVLPAHTHAKPEDCVVISGELRIGASGVQLQSGGFHWMAQDTAHEPIEALQDTLIYLRGALDTVD